jgi:hypothetical protein
VVLEEDLDAEGFGAVKDVAVAFLDDLESVVGHVLRAAGVNADLAGGEFVGDVEPAVGPRAVGLPGGGVGLVDVRAVHGDGAEGQAGLLRRGLHLLDVLLVARGEQLVGLVRIVSGLQDLIAGLEVGQVGVPGVQLGAAQLLAVRDVPEHVLLAGGEQAMETERADAHRNHGGSPLRWGMAEA